MSKAFTAATYLEKAQRAVEGARVLFDAGDTEGACSRAYYAMFDAAHAALRAVGIEVAGAEIKAHIGLLTGLQQGAGTDQPRLGRVEEGAESGAATALACRL